MVITESFRAFVTECLNTGADGIFFATTSWASHDLLTAAQYEEFGRPYDLRVLEAAQGATFNILHICRSNNMLPTLAGYPVHAINWDARDPTNLSLKDGQALSNKAVIGGVARETLLHGQPEDVAAEVKDAIAQSGGRAFMVGPGCAIAPQCPDANLDALHAALDEGSP